MRLLAKPFLALGRRLARLGRRFLRALGLVALFTAVMVVLDAVFNSDGDVPGDGDAPGEESGGEPA